MARPRKTRLHFNRIAMQRKEPRVWTAHNSAGCFGAEKIQIVHKGKVIAETVFSPESRQPRAYFVAHGEVRYEGATAVVEVA